MNNVKGYYDQINHNFALVLMFFGLPWKIVRNLFRVLQQECHRIKTSYGVSEPTYGNKDEKERKNSSGEVGPSSLSKEKNGAVSGGKKPKYHFNDAPASAVGEAAPHKNAYKKK